MNWGQYWKVKRELQKFNTAKGLFDLLRESEWEESKRDWVKETEVHTEKGFPVYVCACRDWHCTSIRCDAMTAARCNTIKSNSNISYKMKLSRTRFWTNEISQWAELPGTIPQKNNANYQLNIMLQSQIIPIFDLRRTSHRKWPQKHQTNWKIMFKLFCPSKLLHRQNK